MWKLPKLVRSQGAVPVSDTRIVFSFQTFQEPDSKSEPKVYLPEEIFDSSWVARLKKADTFRAAWGEHQLLRYANFVEQGADHLLLVGLSQLKEIDAEKLRQLGGKILSFAQEQKLKKISIELDAFLQLLVESESLSPVVFIRSFLEGFLLAAYHFQKYRTSTENNQAQGTKAEESYPFVEELSFSTKRKELWAQLDLQIKEVTAMVQAVRICRDWSNEPSNVGTPSYYAHEAESLALQYGLKCRILNEEELKKEKMGLFLGVGQGSTQENRLVLLEYIPTKAVAAKKMKTLALVGKGVTFDSGGISIKPSARMEEMKHDMTGAATVLGAILTAAAWQVSHRVLGLMAFTENMPDGSAIAPGYVLHARSGQTVEVINTDAEGRLVLADALDYIQDFKPDAVVDVATLTGAVGVALGKHAAAVLGNDSHLIESLKLASKKTGERIWELPLFDEYLEDMKTDLADLRNSANDSYAGTIRAAIFLREFIRKGTPWAHLDIAATAWGTGHLSYQPKKGASGAYVRLLAQWVRES